MPSHPTGAPPAPTRTAPNPTAGRAAWLVVSAGLVAGCPTPAELRINAGNGNAFLTLDHAEDVAAWAGLLDLPAPDVTVIDRAADATHDHPSRLTITSTTGGRDGVRWYVDHYHRQNLDPPSSDPQSPDRHSPDQQSPDPQPVDPAGGCA